MTTTALRGQRQLCLDTNTAFPDMAHHTEVRTYAEYVYATTNVYLQRSEGRRKY